MTDMNMPKTLDDWAPPEPSYEAPPDMSYDASPDMSYDASPPAMPPNIADPFAGADEAYEQAEVRDLRADDLPDGKYQGFVASVKPFTISKGKRAGYAGITLRLCVIAGEHRGATQSHMRSFHAQDPESMSWLKKDLAALGVQEVMDGQGIKLRQLCTERLDLFLDRVVEFQVKRTPSREGEPFVNIYLNRVLPGVAIPADLWESATGGRENSSADFSTNVPPARF